MTKEEYDEIAEAINFEKEFLKHSKSSNEYVQESLNSLDAYIKAMVTGEYGSENDFISRKSVNKLVDELARAISDERSCMTTRGRDTASIMQDILDLPSSSITKKEVGEKE